MRRRLLAGMLLVTLAGCADSQPSVTPSAAATSSDVPQSSPTEPSARASAEASPRASVTTTEGPAHPDAEMRPDLIVANPDEVTAGLNVELTFPQETDRSLAFALEVASGDSWEYGYQLVSDQRGGEPFWQEANGPVEIDLVGVSGPGPDVVSIPPEAPPGEYRLCTMLVPRSICVPILMLPPVP